MAQRAVFWKPGSSGTCMSADALVGDAAPKVQSERSSENELDLVPHNVNAGYSLSQQRARLPIFKVGPPLPPPISSSYSTSFTSPFFLHLLFFFFQLIHFTSHNVLVSRKHFTHVGKTHDTCSCGRDWVRKIDANPSGSIDLARFRTYAQYLYEAGWAAEGRIVACLQPRRVAAISVRLRNFGALASILFCFVFSILLRLFIEQGGNTRGGRNAGPLG
jgi:hypothetical protein